MAKVRLDRIAFEAGTQIRAAINEQVVGEYAERMSEGVTFPPIVLFHDGTAHYLADGFHRYLASQRVGFADISADVRAGTKQDALWFALGANKANGHRMTPQDKRHAILLALQTWPDKSGRELSEQIGVNQRYFADVKSQLSATTQLPDRVTGKDGKSYPASHRLAPERIVAVEEKLRGGEPVTKIAAALQMHTSTVRKIQSAAGITSQGVDRSRTAVQSRRDQMRELAADGFTSRQIASKLGLSEEGCRVTLRAEGIAVSGDVATKNTRRLDSTRIVENMVLDAGNLTSDVALIDFSTLDRARLASWIESLTAAQRSLGSFIRRLKEHEKHEAA